MGRTVLVVGGGGREHALAIGLVESPSVDSVHVAPAMRAPPKLRPIIRCQPVM